MFLTARQSGQYQYRVVVRLVSCPVRSLVTDLGLFEKTDIDGELTLTAVPAGQGSIADRVATAVAATGWAVAVSRSVRELDAIAFDDVVALREWDPRGWFLRG